MATMLDQISRTPLAPRARREIFNTIWDLNLDEKHFASRTNSLKAYFRYYEDQCAHSRGIEKTHQDALNVIQFLKDGGQTLTIIKQKTFQSTRFAIDEEQIDTLIALAARLWLMLYIGDIGQCFIPASTQIVWREGTLDDLVRTVFSARHELSSTVKLEKIINASNLERIAGIRVSWMSNLADHLLMRDDDTQVILFHHVQFLELH